jgi:dTMP kinase
LIAAEGIDNGARSVQMSLLGRWLRHHSANHVIGTQVTESATPVATSLNQAADLADSIENEIVPLLRAGHTVLADGYVFSAMARDAARGLSRKWTRSLYRFAILPNIRLYFRIPLGEALRQTRPASGGYAPLSANPEESFRLYQGRVLEELDAIAGEMDFYTVDGALPAEQQQLAVRGFVSKELALEKHAATS